MDGRGDLEMLLLAGLKGRTGLHGYALIAEIRQRSGGQLDLGEGSAYPVLHRLEAQGLIDSHWEEHGHRRRRLYHLTTRGENVLIAKEAEWRRLVRSVQTVLTPSKLDVVR